MISIVFGVPGSGKTYYAVWWIKRRALQEGDIFFRVRPDVILITNLKLNLDAVDGYIYIEDIRDFAKYMDVDFWRSNLTYIQGRKIIIVMDECQLFFYHFGNDPRVLFFLQYHRHLSVDILLITQSTKSLPTKIFELAEFLIEAVPRSVNPFYFKAFRYRVIHPLDRDVVLRRFHLAFDPVVFYLYSDMIYKPLEEGEKPKNAFTRYYLMLASFLLLTIFLMFSFFLNFSSSSQVKFQPSLSQSSSPPVPQPIQYEDLITEEPTGETREEETGKEEPKPIETTNSEKEPGGYYYIAVEKTKAKTEDIDLTPKEPKISYLP